MKDQQGFDLQRADGNRLIVTYSEQRRKKDAYGRERGLVRLRKKIKSGTLSKEHINNRGYNKFLMLKGSIEVSIDEIKAAQDSVWDGLKGYITNTDLSVEKVVESYRQLWRIEKAFRISKTDLRIRPVYHYRRKRIEAHICIAFVAYTIYKELEQCSGRIQSNASRRIDAHNVWIGSSANGWFKCGKNNFENGTRSTVALQHRSKRLIRVSR